MLLAYKNTSRILKWFWGFKLSMFAFCVVTGVGMIDIAMRYWIGASVVRHGVMQIVVLSVLKSMIWAFPVAALTCLLNRRQKWLVLLILIPVLLVSVEAYSRLNFHRGLGGEWYTLLMTSSADELKDFVLSLFTPYTVVTFLSALILSAVIVVFVIRSVRETISLPFKVRLLACLTIFGVFIFMRHFVTIGWDCTWPYFISNALKNRREFLSLKKCLQPTPKERFWIVDPDKDRPVVVVVIGESATRNDWSLYGYQRKTTPRLDVIPSSRKVVFRDVQTPYPMTVEALKLIFTDATIEEPDISSTLSYVLRQCGFASVLVSNQGHWGSAQSYEALLFASCERQIYIADLGLPLPVYDDAILPIVQSELDDVAGKVVFVHLAGSHIPADARYPKNREVYSLDSVPPNCTTRNPKVGRMVNAYDNSIAYTDYVLGEIIKLVEVKSMPALVLYLSDHGESLRSGGWRVFTDPDSWEIPMVACWSDEYQRQFPQIVNNLRRAENVCLQSDWLYYGLIELFGITGDYDPCESFLSDEFNRKHKPRRFERSVR